jgi:hypothetical protein
MAAIGSIDLSSLDLFGNDAAEDEREDVFRSYAIERREVAAFADEGRRICVAQAYKGEGKTALLLMTKSKLLERKKIEGKRHAALVVWSTAADVAPEEESEDYDQHVRAWKRSIARRIAAELGSRINCAVGDDAIALVEEAEKSGAKPRNFVSTVTDRLKVGNKIPENKKLGASDAGASAARFLAASDYELWLFVDDVDKNFEDTDPFRKRCASFFDACRALCKVFPDIRIRTAIRPNVWSILAEHYESMSHMAQYMVKLAWTEEQMRSLLALRIVGYLQRRSGSVTRRQLDLGPDRERQEIARVFGDPLRWSGHDRPPHVVLHTLAMHRPRWMIELCKAAAQSAVARKSPLISLDDIVSQLKTFGQQRVLLTVAEFRSLCPELSELITSFNRSQEEFTTDELMKHIDRKILEHVRPKISGVSGRSTNRDVARLLFQVGLFFGRRDKADLSYEHVSFAENPYLFVSRTSLDDGLSWEIHPIFRQALDMRDDAGRETKRRQ